MKKQNASSVSSVYPMNGPNGPVFYEFCSDEATQHIVHEESD